MKKLTITYGDQTLCEADVAEFQFSESSDAVSVVGKFPKPQRAVRPAAGKSGGFAGLLSAAAQARKEPPVTAFVDNTTEGAVNGSVG